jgi:hypothetical protein
MKGYLVTAAIVLAVLAITFRVSAVKSIVTGTP